MARVGAKLADGRVLALIEQMLKAGVMESAKGWQPTESGTPQGAVISPLLANVYLDPLDHQMARSGYQMVRYADDPFGFAQGRLSSSSAPASRNVLHGLLWVEAELSAEE